MKERRKEGRRGGREELRRGENKVTIGRERD